MATSSLLKARGLHTFNSYLSAIPEGAQLVADNVNIDKEGVIEPRRGIKQYGEVGNSSNDIAKQLIVYKNRILAHYDTKLAWDNGSGVFTDFGSTFGETQAGLRVKSVESNGNLYITTDEGIKKIAAVNAAGLGSADISLAGGIKALVPTGRTIYTGPTFMPPYSKVSYRVTWGTKDANENFIQGPPSPAVEITNPANANAAVELTFDVPNGITTDYFYRIYRTNVAIQDTPTFAGIADLQTGDEMRLVIENAYVSGSSITIEDITPETFRDNGVNLYTNEFSGEGILQSNDAPPFAKDISLYKNAVFFANTRTKHRLNAALLGVGPFKSFGSKHIDVNTGLPVEIQITNITYSAPDTTITFAANHGLQTGGKVVIFQSGAAPLDGVQTIKSVTPTTIVIEANGTGAVATNCSVFGSTFSVTRGTTQEYYLVGRPEISSVEITNFALIPNVGAPAYVDAWGVDDLTRYVFWFKRGATQEAPTGIVGQTPIFIEVDVQASASNNDMALALADAIDENTFDLSTESVVGGVTRFRTTTSGTATMVATSGAGIGNPTTIQDGTGENVGLKYIRLSTYLSPGQSIDDTARSLCRVVTSNALDVVNAYYIFKANDLPGQILFEARDILTTPFVVSNSDAGAFSPDLVSGQTSNNEDKPNRVYFSKLNQPEAVPIVNYFDVGPKDRAINRIIGLRDSLFIFKEEGIYRLTGENSANYFVTLFDNSAILLAPDTAVVLNNQIYAFTTQGVSFISETGTQIVSRPIENILNKVASPSFTNYKSICFGAAYEADRSYFVWVPEVAEDEVAKRCYRFNTFTQTWTSWTVTANSAIVDPIANKLYIGAGDTNIVEVERKDLLRTDYADREYTLQLLPGSVNGTELSVGTTALIARGDLISQRQYVTIAAVLRIARKLGNDAGLSVPARTYFTNYQINPGAALNTELSIMITYLNSDTGGAFNTVYSSNQQTFQVEYNALIDSLNASPLINQINFLNIEGYVDVESLVASVVDAGNIELTYAQPYIEGDVTHYKSINSQVVWAPATMGEPSIMKHIREGVVLFDNASFVEATYSVNTDLSPNFEEVTFAKEGFGAFGAATYSATTWGGEGTAVPFRTLIPRQKQRCRFIRARLTHNVAFDRYAILGIAYTFEINSERGYK